MSSNEIERVDSVSQLLEQQQQQFHHQQQSYPQQTYPPQPYPPQPSTYPYPYPPQPYPQQSYHYSQQPYPIQQPPQKLQQQPNSSHEGNDNNCSKTMVEYIDGCSGIITLSHQFNSCFSEGKYFPPVVGTYNTPITHDNAALASAAATASSTSSNTQRTTSAPSNTSFVSSLPESKVNRLRVAPSSPSWGSLSTQAQSALIAARRKYGMILLGLLLVSLILLIATGSSQWVVIEVNMESNYTETYSIFQFCSNNINDDICQTGPTEVRLIFPYLLSFGCLLITFGYSFLVFKKSYGALFLPFGAAGTFITLLATILQFSAQTYAPDIYDPDTQSSDTIYQPGLGLACSVLIFMVIILLISLRLVQLEASLLLKAPRTQNNDSFNESDYARN